MRRRDLDDVFRVLGRREGAVVTFRRRGRHTMVLFDGVPRTLYRDRSRRPLSRRLPLPEPRERAPQRVRVSRRRETVAWAIEFPDAPEAHSHAYVLAQVREMAADALSLWFGHVVRRDDLDVDINLGAGLNALVDQAVAARRSAEVARARASGLLRQAVRACAGQGMTLRDTGFVLGMTHQRAADLARELGVERAPLPAPSEDEGSQQQAPDEASIGWARPNGGGLVRWGEGPAEESPDAEGRGDTGPAAGGTRPEGEGLGAGGDPER